MQGKPKKYFVYTEYLKNEKGLTFLSLIISLVILFSFIPFLSYLLKSAEFHSDYDELSINQFFIFFRNEFMEANDYEVYDKRIIFDLNNGKKATFEFYNQLIVRRVDGGFEVYLRDVADLRFIPLNYGIKAVVTSLSGEVYEKTFVLYE